MVEIEKPRIECIDSPEDGSYGKYIVEPLERGYGTTLGNSLRRVLLSSLPGTAATSIKIAGVQHEFSTIPGVKEDVTEIVLNVKKIIAKLHCQGTKTVFIDATGEREVTAGDIKTDAEVEILNPELHICSLGPDATFNMEITLSHGRGYVPSDKNKTPSMPIGTIAVDPKEYPYGTKLYIRSSDGSFVYGYALASDTGGFVDGAVDVNVDLFYETYRESALNSLRTVDIYVLEWGNGTLYY